MYIYVYLCASCDSNTTRGNGSKYLPDWYPFVCGSIRRHGLTIFNLFTGSQYVCCFCSFDFWKRKSKKADLKDLFGIGPQISPKTFPKCTRHFFLAECHSPPCRNLKLDLTKPVLVPTGPWSSSPPTQKIEVAFKNTHGSQQLSHQLKFAYCKFIQIHNIKQTDWKIQLSLWRKVY